MSDDELSDSGVNIVFLNPTPIASVDGTKFAAFGTPWAPSGTILQVNPTTVNLTFLGWSADPGGGPYNIFTGLAPGIGASSGTITP